MNGHQDDVLLEEIHPSGPSSHSFVALRNEFRIKESTKSMDRWIAFLLVSFHQKTHVEINDLYHKEET